ncbi:hypothetical protein PMAYCL1PPCAC_23664, partial [Pristionchus mayeri]
LLLFQMLHVHEHPHIPISGEFSAAEKCLLDTSLANSAVENAVQEEVFENYKEKMDMENCLKSVVYGGHTIEEAAKVFNMDLESLISLHRKISSVLMNVVSMKEPISLRPIFVRCRKVYQQHHVQCSISSPPGSMEHTRHSRSIT